MKDILDIATKLFKIVFYISFIVGGIVVFAYCIRIGYLPRDIGFGDGLFFIAVAMWFSLFYVLYLACISATSLLVVWIVRIPINWVYSLTKVKALFNCEEPRINRFDWSLYLLLVAGALFALGLYTLSYYQELRGFVISTAHIVVVFFFITAALLTACRGEEPLINSKLWNLKSQKERGIIIVIIFLVFVSPLTYSEVFHQMSRSVFTQIGLSVKHAEIYLDKEKKPMFNGFGIVKDDYLILKDVNVLWTGVGSETVVEVEINNEPRKYVLKTNELSFSY